MPVITRVTLGRPVILVEPICIETMLRSSIMEVTATPPFSHRIGQTFDSLGSGVTESMSHSSSLRPSCEDLIRRNAKADSTQVSCHRGTLLKPVSLFPFASIWQGTRFMEEDGLQSWLRGRLNGYITQLPGPSKRVRSTTLVFFEISSIVIKPP